MIAARKIRATITVGDLRVSLLEEQDEGPRWGTFASHDNMIIEKNEPDALGKDSWRALPLDSKSSGEWRKALRTIVVRTLETLADNPPAPDPFIP